MEAFPWDVRKFVCFTYLLASGLRLQGASAWRAKGDANIHLLRVETGASALPSTTS